MFSDNRIHFTEKHHGLNVHKVSELYDLNDNNICLKNTFTFNCHFVLVHFFFSCYVCSWNNVKNTSAIAFQATWCVILKGFMFTFTVKSHNPQRAKAPEVWECFSK